MEEELAPLLDAPLALEGEELRKRGFASLRLSIILLTRRYAGEGGLYLMKSSPSVPLLWERRGTREKEMAGASLYGKLPLLGWGFNPVYCRGN